jgi:transmembrane sensor
MDKINIEQLVEKYLSETLTEDEKALFFEQLRLPENEACLSEAMQKDWSEETLTQLLFGEEEVGNRIKANLLTQIEPQAPIVRMKTSRSWVKWVAAAVFIGLVTSVAIVSLNKDKQVPSTPIAVATDVVAPDKTKARILLADGRTVSLDSLNAGLVIQQEGAQVETNAAGEIVYQQVAKGALKQLYNTLQNPRGSQVVNLTLSDGTKVWLNAASSLKYPVAFLGNTREVEITGEAYFEVAKDRARRFVVRGSGVTTEVLGTHFNVNNYKDDGLVKVTLMEGKVKTIAAGDFALLSPGQQAQVDRSVKVTEKVDLEEVMAWKNGVFSFKGTSIVTLLQELSRWYDLEITYAGDIPRERITGEIKREASLTQVLKMLEFAGIAFRLEGKKIIVGK